jgi:cyclopropane fatty-acyl-phospholipid synthase-like methyltransferase
MDFNDFLIYITILLQFGVITWVFIRTLIVITSLFSDVPYVPVKRKTFKKGIEILGIQTNDSVLEIGSGDGRNLLSLSKQYPNINFVGIEIHPALYLISNIKKIICRRKNIKFIKQDAYKFEEYGKFNKIFFYMYSGFSDKFMKAIEDQIKKNTEIISLVFSFGKNFQATHNIDVYDVKYINKIQKIYRWKK